MRRGLKKEQESNRERAVERVFWAAGAACTKAQRQSKARCAREMYPRENKCIFLAV